jgi:hypothetical protein
MEPVMWVRPNTLAAWEGHNNNQGFHILRGVPRGSPQEIRPLPIETSNFTEIHKTFDVMSPEQRDEWNAMKAESNAIEGENEFELVDSPPDFDWAAPLLQVLELSSNFIILILSIMIAG